MRSRQHSNRPPSWCWATHSTTARCASVWAGGSEMKWLHIYLLVAESVINPGALEPQHVSLLLHLNGFDTGRFGHGVRAAFARFPFDGPSTSTQRDLPDSCLDLLIDAAHNV